jgi:uncharacterized protein (DUF1015 family)
MVEINRFRALRPKPEYTKQVAELPYDVVDSAEAKAIAQENQLSFFHITKPEIDFDDHVDPESEQVYQAGRKNLQKMIDQEIMVLDNDEYLYLYSQQMDGRWQTGLVACVSVDDYLENKIKKHEKTRAQKETDRTNHIDTINANAGPVFMLYRQDNKSHYFLTRAQSVQPEIDFMTDNGVRHVVRMITDPELIDGLTATFDEKELYIADGHHRAAAAANVCKIRRTKNPNHTGDEEYNKFVAVMFPANELQVLAYNRVVKDLNGLSKEEFFDKIRKSFDLQTTSQKEPACAGQVSMYLEHEWYSLVPKVEIPQDAVGCLDVATLQNFVLHPILDIADPRTDLRIDFIGGGRGTEELERLVNSGQYQVAFSMYPTTVEQLMRVSDCNGNMPPKSTWFEPKLLSGLFVHLL